MRLLKGLPNQQANVDYVENQGAKNFIRTEGTETFRISCFSNDALSPLTSQVQIVTFFRLSRK